MENKQNKAWLFLTSQAITLFGSSITQFAIIWYVTLTTSSGLWVTILTLCAYVPQFIISFFSGVWADRYNKKHLIILADLLISFTTLIFIIVFPYITNNLFVLIAISIISAIRSFGSGIQTPAVSASIPLLVPKDKLMKYNGINSTIQSLVQFVAPMLAGAILSFSDFNVSLIIDVATALIGIILLSFVVIPNLKEEHESTFIEMKEGFKYTKTNSFIGTTLIIYGIFIFLCIPVGFLASLYVSRYFKDVYWYLTLVEICGLIGMVISGILLSTWGGFTNRVKTLVLGITLFGLLAIGMGIINNFIIYLVLMFIYGFVLTMIQTASTVILQEYTAKEVQGRVFGLFSAIFAGMLPLGMLLFGPLADFISLKLIMIISGILLVILAIVIYLNKKYYSYIVRKKSVE